MSRPAAEAAVLHRTRLRLMAWSGGTTLVILVVLGIAIYAAAASSLAASGTRQLQERLAQLGSGSPMFTDGIGPTGSGALTVTSDPRQPGVALGGTTSGTIGMVTSTSSGGGITTQVTGAGGLEAGMAPFHVDEATLARAAAGETVAIETTIGSAPVRIVARPVNAVGGPDAAGPAPAGSRPALSVGVVIGDRTAELDTLRTLLLVLLGGGLVVLFASITAGYFYAGRALVPIRDALSRQREFAADASHELRTPLAITRAAVAAARLGREEPDVVDGALDDIDAGVDRMASLVDDLLLLARADAEAVELALGDTDLGLAAAEAAEALEPLAATRGIRIALDVRPAPVRGDERRLRQLAGILVDNAIRHSPDGGTVGVTVRDGAVLVVEDEGAGIPPEHVERVFERFWRAPGSPSGGTGLGLAIARWIAERHGGSITASQRSGPGAAFTVRLPEARDPHRG